MNLVEAEETGPVEGDAPLVTPPRPPHRRVSVSLVFTLTVLIGTVVAIYLTFPARHNVLMTEAIARHHEAPAWDLTSPTPGELRAWAIGVIGKDPPLPTTGAKIVGAQRIRIFDRDAALIGLDVGADRVTYLVQRAHGISPDQAERDDGDDKAIAWRLAPYTCIAVGPAASVTAWRAVLPK